RVHAEVGAAARELERGSRRHADHRYHEAHGEAIGETELGGRGVGTPFLPHAQESRAEARYEVREPAREAHVLLQSRHHGDIAAAYRISREPGPELHASRVGELIVPRHDAGVEGHAHDAARRSVSSLDGL